MREMLVHAATARTCRRETNSRAPPAKRRPATHWPGAAIGGRIVRINPTVWTTQIAFRRTLGKERPSHPRQRPSRGDEQVSKQPGDQHPGTGLAVLPRQDGEHLNQQRVGFHVEARAERAGHAGCAARPSRPRRRAPWPATAAHWLTIHPARAGSDSSPINPGVQSPQGTLEPSSRSWSGPKRVETDGAARADRLAPK